jgi:hypothetical protein
MSQAIMTIKDATNKIEAGRVLVVAGEEGALRQLPKGSWMGGTIPYFMSDTKGGVVSKELVFVTDLTDIVESWKITVHDEVSLAKVYTDAFENGFSFILIPATSKPHVAFAMNAPNYENFGVRPLIGWITGVHLDDLGKVSPKVFDGATGKDYTDAALVMAVKLPAGKAADIGIINLFEQGSGDTLTFPQEGFSAKDVYVNGSARNFAEYIKEKGLDTKLPLVADYCGASINISFQGVDEQTGTVNFYAPVFSGIRYKHAKPVSDYMKSFNSLIAKDYAGVGSGLVFSCNCILNYLYSELEGKQTKPFVGPITFGEIAYQLLNQTLVYLELHDVA